jgi:hypothetical protein
MYYNTPQMRGIFMIKFENSEQMKAFLKKESKRLKISPTNTYHTFIARSLLERISVLSKQQFIVKGSSAEIAYLGRLVRSITDLDMATMGTFDENICPLASIMCNKDFDNFKYSFLKMPEKTKTGIYKLSFKAMFGSIVQPIGVDFQENYNRMIEPKNLIMPPIFEGDKPFEIYVPSFEEYLAEKLCIIAESNKIDIANTRVKDFYDVYELHGGKYDSDKLTEYFKKMIKLRGKIPMDKVSTIMFNHEFVNNHQEYWDHAKKRYDFLDNEIDFEGAVYYTRAVLREQLQKNGQDMPDNISVGPCKVKK